MVLHGSRSPSCFSHSMLLLLLLQLTVTPPRKWKLAQTFQGTNFASLPSALLFPSSRTFNRFPLNSPERWFAFTERARSQISRQYIRRCKSKLYLKKKIIFVINSWSARDALHGSARAFLLRLLTLRSLTRAFGVPFMCARGEQSLWSSLVTVWGGSRADPRFHRALGRIWFGGPPLAPQYHMQLKE